MLAEELQLSKFAILVAPWLLRPIFKVLQWRVAGNPRQLFEDALHDLPARDQATCTDPVMWRMLLETASEPFRSGTGGLYDDTLAVARPWGFAPEGIETPVWLWQGDADASVLPALADELAQKLPHCHASVLPEEGHFLVFTHWQSILQTLAQQF
jgi:pimeloyl-ACP methyl ester carboxylesterase